MRGIDMGMFMRSIGISCGGLVLDEWEYECEWIMLHRWRGGIGGGLWGGCGLRIGCVCWEGIDKCIGKSRKM